ncbi:MAG: glycosyl transferase, partial [Myxococcales bacterium]|nr:glycosyl transferase [Myxococcales bacterium]
MSSVRDYAIGFGIALAASLVLTLVVRTVARRWKLVAKPRPDRWHKKPTALYGGIGIFLSFALTSLVLHRAPHVAGSNLLLACAAGMFLVGLVDDIWHLKPYAKLVGQIFFCTAVTMFGLRLHWVPSAVIDTAITIFWLVGITNAINLLDNLDGLAGGVAAIAALYLVYFCHVSGFVTAALLAATFAGAVVGFLFFNFNPASIFMGDCGSLFLGFFIGAVTLVSNSGGMRRNVVAVLAIPVLLLLIPIVDTTLVTISRRMAGRPVSQGGRDHTSHRLVALGLSERNAALTLWIVAALSGAVAVTVRNSSWMIGALLVPTFFMGCLFFAVFVGGVKVYQPVADEREGGGRALLPTLADFTYKRRLFEVLCDVAVIVLAYYAGFLLRFDGELVRPYYALFLNSLPIVIVVQLGAFLILGLYDGLWRYTSMSDLSRQLRAVAGGWVVSTLAVVFVFRLENVSRSVLILDALLLTVGVAGTRISFRLLRTWAARFQSPSEGKRVLIYGAGDGGELLLRELMQNRELGLNPVGFVDDDPQKQGRVIHGIRVLGPLDRLGEFADKERVDEVVVSTNRLANDKSELLAAVCKEAGLRHRRMR